MEKEIKIECPEGYEIDKENSTFGCIKFKSIQQRFWDNLLNISGYTISNGVSNYYPSLSIHSVNKNVFATKKLAESALALAQISQLIEHFYGGIISNKDWSNNIIKYAIYRANNTLKTIEAIDIFEVIAFRTAKYRELFLEEHQELLKQYFMID